MSIETSPKTQGANATAKSVHRSDKLSGKSDTPVANKGFSALMDSFSATDSVSDTVTTDALIPQADPLAPAVNPDTDAASTASIASTLSATVASATPPQTTTQPGSLATTDLAKGDGNTLFTGLRPVSTPMGRPAAHNAMLTAHGTDNAPKVALSNQGKESTTMNLMLDQSATKASSHSQVQTLLENKNVVLPQTMKEAQIDLHDMQISMAAIRPEPEVASVVATGVMGEGWLRQTERHGTKSSSSSSESGFESAFGQTMANVERDRAVFEVSAPSALVPDSSVAETVSYWVTHGVQNAELKLEGFGGDPVEVSISINGDQAQIGFRTDQADVRQVLEGATSHLKELLMSEGLQLSGVSIGSSGKEGANSGEQRQRQDAKRVLFAKTEIVRPLTSRVVGSSVGRSLDLFV